MTPSQRYYAALDRIRRRLEPDLVDMVEGRKEKDEGLHALYTGLTRLLKADVPKRLLAYGKVR